MTMPRSFQFLRSGNRVVICRLSSDTILIILGQGTLNERRGPACMQYKSSMLDEQWEPRILTPTLKNRTSDVVRYNDLRYNPSKAVDRILEEMARTVETISCRMSEDQCEEWEDLLCKIKSAPGNECKTCVNLRRKQRINSVRVHDAGDIKQEKSRNYNAALKEIRAHLTTSDAHAPQRSTVWPFIGWRSGPQDRIEAVQLDDGDVPVDDIKVNDGGSEPLDDPNDARRVGSHPDSEPTEEVVDLTTEFVDDHKHVDEPAGDIKVPDDDIVATYNFNHRDHELVDLLEDEAGPLMSIGRKRKKRIVKDPLRIGNIAAVRPVDGPRDAFWIGRLHKWTVMGDGSKRAQLQWISNETDDMTKPVRLMWIVKRPHDNTSLTSYDARKPSRSTPHLSDKIITAHHIITWWPDITSVLTTSHKVREEARKDIVSRIQQAPEWADSKAPTG